MYYVVGWLLGNWNRLIVGYFGVGILLDWLVVGVYLSYVFVILLWYFLLYRWYWVFFWVVVGLWLGYV